jgi:hypothetical protein
MRWPFQEWGATTVVAGHAHVYERLNVNGFPYFVNGLGGESISSFGTTIAGSEVRYRADYGAMLVDASNTAITFQFISRAGVVVDTHSINSGSSLPIVSIAAPDATAAEPGTDVATFTVSRTGSTSNVLGVNYTIGGTASNGTDYSSLSGTVTIPAGSASAQITLTPIDDTNVEGNETVVLTLSTSASYTRGTPNNATVTIGDNEPALPTVTISASDTTATEPGTDAGAFTVSRTGSTSNVLGVNYTIGGTASNGTDYSSLMSRGMKRLC